MLTLIHESIHYIHGSGHRLETPEENPDRYCQLILELRYGSEIAIRFRAWRDTVSQREAAEQERIRQILERVIEMLEQEQ